MNVLIVDDSKAMQNIMTKSMKGIGYVNDTYSYANDGEEALRMIRNGSPDLVLCDMHMPKMTGIDLLRALRNENNRTRMIIVSIDDDPKTVANVTALGGDAYLKKPFTSEQLFDTITGILGKRLEKKTKSAIDIHTLVPSQQVIERVFGSLAASDMKLTVSRFSEVDFNRAPYYGGTFQDEKGKLISSVWLDVLAANTIAAILNRKPLKTAIDAANAQKIDVEAKEALLAFLGVFSGLCQPLQSGQLQEVHSEHLVADPHAQLEKHLVQFVDTALVYSISCGVSQGGKMLLITP